MQQQSLILAKDCWYLNWKANQIHPSLHCSRSSVIDWLEKCVAQIEPLFCFLFRQAGLYWLCIPELFECTHRTDSQRTQGLYWTIIKDYSFKQKVIWWNVNVLQGGRRVPSDFRAGQPPPPHQCLPRPVSQPGLRVPRIHLPQAQVLGQERGGWAQRHHDFRAAQVSMSATELCLCI